MQPPTTAQEQAAPPRLATYFACYPDSLALPSEGAAMVGWEEGMLGYTELGEIVLHYEDNDPVIGLPPALATELFVSIRFHRGHRQYSTITESLRDLLTVVHGVAPQLTEDAFSPDEAESGDPYAAYTVVEMVTPLVALRGGAWTSMGPSNEVMADSLTRCIDALRQIVNAYRLLENLPLSIPARERLGPMIMSATRPADPAQGGWDDAGSLVVNGFATAGRPVAAPARPNIQDDIGRFLYQHALGEPKLAAIELEADANAALNQGDFRSAVMLTHSASEVGLDGVLMALCWEEGMNAADTAAEFFPPLLTRVRTRYHNRIGGNWATNRNPTLGRWHSQLVLLRHSVAHTGLLPERHQVDQALEAHRALRTFLLDRVTASMHRYPKTVALFVTEAGLRRRNAWTRRAREAVEAADMDTLHDFTAWRDLVLAARVSSST